MIERWEKMRLKFLLNQIPGISLFFSRYFIPLFRHSIIPFLNLESLLSKIDFSPQRHRGHRETFFIWRGGTRQIKSAIPEGLS
jgi:hypothetical protein